MSYFKTLILAVTLVSLSLQVTAVPATSDDSLPCTICKDIVEDFESWITSDATEQQITDWIASACEGITLINDQYADYVNICKLVLHAEITQLIEALIAGYTPEQVCTDLFVCTP